jgi:hypothetical protein
MGARRRWLERIASACEHLIVEASGYPTDSTFVALQRDAVDLLARVRQELQEGEEMPPPDPHE